MLAAVALVASGLAVSATPAQAADDRWSLPDGPLSGMVTVGTNIPVDEARYVGVEVRTRSTAGEDVAVSTLKANAGPGTTFNVDTWGVSGSHDVDLLTCTYRYLDACTTVATERRDFVQAAAVTATITYPARPSQPTEEAPPVVTAHNDGRGFLAARWRTAGSQPQQSSALLPLRPDQPTPVTPGYLPSGPAYLDVLRCAYVSYDTVCEDPWLSEATSVLAELPISQLMLSRDHVSFDAAWDDDMSDVVANMESSPTAPAFSVSWTIEKLDGTVVLGPVTDAKVAGTHTFRFGRSRLAGRTTSGEHVVRAVAHGTDRRTGADVLDTESAHVWLIGGRSTASPPRVVRHSATDLYIRKPNTLQWSTWTMEPLPGAAISSATLTVYDVNGNIADHGRQSFDPCSIDFEDCPGGRYALRWWTEYPGRFTAKVRLVDSAGRVLTIPLGDIRVWARNRIEKSFSYRPAKVRVRTGRIEGRCSDITVPGQRGVAGSVGLLSNKRCSSRAGTADATVQRFALRVPALPTGRLFDVVINADVRGGRREVVDDPFLNYYRMRYRYVGATSRWRSLGEKQNAQWVGWVPTPGAEWSFTAPSRSTSQISGKSLGYELRVSNGSWVDVRRIRVRVSYEGWTLGAHVA